MHQKFAGFEDATPYQYAVVELEEGPRIVTRVAVGGRLIRLPVVQQAYVMDLRARLIDWSLVGASARDTTPVDARGYLAFAIQPVQAD